MSRLFLIRHGEAESAWGGDDDDPGLSAAGQAQAAETARELAGIRPLALLTSPMRRCLDTAAPYERLVGRRASVEPRVSEVPTPAGIADRRVWLQENFPWRGGAPRSWETLDPHLKAWRETLLGCLCEVESDTVVFSHFIAINVAVSAALGRAETIVCKPGYASITELEVSPSGLSLVRMGAEMTGGEVR